MLMAAARLNLPSIFVSGGPMLSLMTRADADLTLSSFEAVGAYKSGKITEMSLGGKGELLPGCGSCSGMFTANSMIALPKQ